MTAKEKSECYQKDCYQSDCRELELHINEGDCDYINSEYLTLKMDKPFTYSYGCFNRPKVTIQYQVNELDIKDFGKLQKSNSFNQFINKQSPWFLCKKEKKYLPQINNLYTTLRHNVGKFVIFVDVYVVKLFKRLNLMLKVLIIIKKLLNYKKLTQIVVKLSSGMLILLIQNFLRILMQKKKLLYLSAPYFQIICNQKRFVQLQSLNIQQMVLQSDNEDNGDCCFGFFGDCC